MTPILFIPAQVYLITDQKTLGLFSSKEWEAKQSSFINNQAATSWSPASKQSKMYTWCRA